MGVSRAALRRWAEAHEEIAKALEIDAEAADFLVEEAIFSKALAGDTKAIEFWLKYRSAANSFASSAEAQTHVDYTNLASLINEPPQS
jgi:hypothetical protein